ncbi:MAG: hypothetical protein F6K28_17475 [Microcoleus sp. SIO2G3]|nr:hypothetical protein [Microcoleus sp. SIO2G3]
MKLSLEQEFYLKVFEEQIKQISLEQAKVLLSQIQRQLLLREALFKKMLKESLLSDFPPTN